MKFSLVRDPHPQNPAGHHDLLLALMEMVNTAQREHDDFGIFDVAHV